MRLIVYARVSTDGQAVEGVSLADQEARCRAYALAGGHEVVRVETDAGVSAKSLERPALARALSAVQRGEADAVIVTKLDRLTRSVRDLEELIESGVQVVSLGETIDTTTAAGRMLVRLLGTVAQWEREAIGERTKAALAHLRDTGVKLGRPPLTTPEQAQRARELRAGGATYDQIAAALSTPERAWSRQTARRAVGL